MGTSKQLQLPSIRGALKGQMKIWPFFVPLGMEYSVYILYSKILDRFEIGQTQDLNERILFHSEKQFAGSFTTKSSDWKFFHSILCKSRTQAMQVESHIKKNEKSEIYPGR